MVVVVVAMVVVIVMNNQYTQLIRHDCSVDQYSLPKPCVKTRSKILSSN